MGQLTCGNVIAVAFRDFSPSPDVSMRLALNQQSLQPIVQDAPAIFLMHSISSMLVKPYIHGYTWTPIDIPLERHLRIQH